MNTSDKETLKIQQNRLPARQKESSSVSSDNVSSARSQNRVSNNKASGASKKAFLLKIPELRAARKQTPAPTGSFAHAAESA